MSSEMICGGVNPQVKEATPEVQSLVDQIKDDVESRLNRKFEKFEARHYKTQVVAGTNYFVKVHVGGDEFLHVRIYHNLQRNVSLTAVQEAKKHEDALEYFQ